MFSLTDMIQRTAGLHPGTCATLHNGRQHSWAEFVARVARLAGGLRDRGVKKGDKVAILALNSDRFMEYFFAVAWAGAVFVPINIRLAPAEVLYWLENSESTVLYIDRHFLHLLPEIRQQQPAIHTVVYLDEGEPPAGLLAYEETLGDAIVPQCRGGDELAGIFYTGGTTGRSKGVLLSHRNLMTNVLQIACCHPSLKAGDVYLHAAPMFHMADGIHTMLSATLGLSSVFLPVFEPLACLKILEQHKVQFTALVPTMIGMLLHHPHLQRYDLSSLKTLDYGASPMPEAFLHQLMAVLPDLELLQMYGQTEAAPVLTMLPPHCHTCDPASPHGGKLRSAGKALPGVRLEIVDDSGRALPPGEVGEVVARGDNVMLGYKDLPEATAQTLAGGWLHTGDAGYLDEEGFLFMVDRVKDMIVTGGENVYSAETEQALYQHPAILECAVIGLPDDDWGERVHAVVVLKDEQPVEQEELIVHCQTLIAHYKCPRSVEFRQEALPKSGAGKILKKDLRAPHWQGRERGVS